MMKLKTVYGFLVLLVLGILFFTLWSRRNAAELREHDEAIVKEVDEAIERYLSTLKPDDPISQRYGKFVELAGDGYGRSSYFISWPKIFLNRTARFEKASVRCPVLVGTRGPAKLLLRLQPSTSWMANNPDWKLVVQGSELIVIGPDASSGSTALAFFVTHPRFFVDFSELVNASSRDAEFQRFVDELVASVEGPEAALSYVKEDWDFSQRLSEPVEHFLMRSFEHPNPRVGLEALRILRPATLGQRVSLSEAAMDQLLSLVADVEKSEELRKEAARTCIQLSETEPTKLYEQLRELGDSGHFAIPVLVEYMNDRNQRNWRAGMGLDAPIGAVELLESWGPASSSAVPTLVAILKEHPNRWNYVPAAARALVAIDPSAHSALEQLQLNRSERYSNPLHAAGDVIPKLARSQELASEKPLSFANDNEQNAFYPLFHDTTYYWASRDGRYVYLIKNDTSGGRLYCITMDTGQCRHVLDLESTFPGSVAGDGDNFHVLRLLQDQDTRSVVVDTWSLEQKKRIKQRLLYNLAAVQPKQTTGVSDVVWSSDRKVVAFNQWVRTPIRKGTREGHSESLRIVIRRLDQPRFESEFSFNGRVTPIRFSDDNMTLYLNDTWFQRIAAFDIESRESVPVLTGADCVAQVAVERSQSAWIPIRQRSTLIAGVIEVLDAEASTVQQVPLKSKAAYLSYPFELAVAIAADGQQVVVLTEHSLDQYEIKTGELKSRSIFLLPSEVVPLMIQCVNDKVLVVGTSKRGSSQSNWIRTFPISVDKNFQP